MSRQYSADLNAGGYPRRPGRSLPADVSYQTRDSSRTCPIGSRNIHSSSAGESESERGQNRRRIAVACSRCRKRKIKCSGDPGNGQGCANCKTAGAEFGTCQFLRVNSQNYGITMPQQQWPYHVDGLASLPSGLASMPSVLNHTGSALDPFAMNNTYSMNSLCPSSYPGTSSLARTQPSTNLSSHYQLMPNRADSCTSLSSFPLDNYFDPLSMSNGHYISPGHISQASSAWQWSSSGRPSIGYDPDLPARYVSPNTSYGDAVFTPGSSSIDPASSFPTMRALANSLPRPKSLRNSDRVLPNLRGSLGLPPSDTTAGNQGLITDLPSIVPWGPERVVTERSQTPVNTGSSSLGAFSMTATDGKRSTTPPETQQTAFGYLEHSPPTGSTTPTTEYSSTKTTVASSTADMVSATMQSHLLSTSTYESGLSSDTILRRDGSAANLYTYRTGSGSKDISRSSDGDGKLLNGQPYMSYHLQQQKPMTYNSQLRESNEISTRLSHRPSITSVGSSR